MYKSVGNGMASRRTPIRHILIPALAVLVLSGIVFAEVPELLRLTEDITNDFTVRKTNTLVLRVFLDTNNYVGMAGLDSDSASGLLFSRPRSLDKAAIVPSKLFLLHSDFRT
jgi:hypothetical protein